MFHTLEEVSALFTPAELAAIDAATEIDLFGARNDALTSTVAWANHVEKLDVDRALTVDDHSVWTEHDLIAAMYMRDRASRALALLPHELAERLLGPVAAADDQYRGFTVEDSGVRINAINMIPKPDRAWWWYRVPADGPVAVFLSRYDAEGNYVGQSEGDESKLIAPPVGHDDSAIPGSQAG
jgi:hypothetical protein